MDDIEILLNISSGIPRRAVNRFTAARKSSFAKDITGSMWTALVRKQMEIAK